MKCTSCDHFSLCADFFGTLCADECTHYRLTMERRPVPDPPKSEPTIKIPKIFTLKNTTSGDYFRRRDSEIIPLFNDRLSAELYRQKYKLIEYAVAEFCR